MEITKKYKKYFITAIGILTVLLLSLQVALPQFLTDEGKAPEVKKEEKSGIPSKDRGLPPYIARNIKAVKLSNVTGAVRITWSVHPEFDEDFIVGRTVELPYTGERALKAVSIKVVPSVADSSIIDSGLPPGEYYYVILSKDKVKDRSIELYPDVNYTSVPVVIEKDIPSASYRGYPEQITLIHGLVINMTQVLLTWKGIQSSGIVYTIYRSSSPLNTLEKLRGAKKIAFITDGSESFIDKGIKKTGRYFYAVSTKDLSGNEDLQLIPDQSYTDSGIFITFSQQNAVSNLKAQLTYTGSVRVNWDGVNFTSGEYLIYRGASPISNAEKLALAKKIGTVDMTKTEYLDRKPGTGRHFYAVLVKQKDGTTDTTLVARSNYTVDPISVGKMIRLRSITARAREGKVLIQWRYSGETAAGAYQLMMTKSRVGRATDLMKGRIVDKIDISKREYTDRAPPEGKLYYSLVPEDFVAYEKFTLKDGVNITGPVYAKKTEPELDTDRRDVEKEDVADLDKVLRRYFFRAEYPTAIKKLENIVSQSDNEYEIAKARLFIGRSWLELRRYNRALDYFLYPTVGKYFPKDSKFWREYAISRLR
jgi:hypothetical protein